MSVCQAGKEVLAYICTVQGEDKVVNANGFLDNMGEPSLSIGEIDPANSQFCQSWPI